MAPWQAQAVRRLPIAAVLASGAVYWGTGKRMPLTVPLAVMLWVGDLALLRILVAGPSA